MNTSNSYSLRARAIFMLNNRDAHAYLAARNCPYYFLLVDEQDQILAECAVYPRKKWWSKRIHEYHITDVRVSFVDETSLRTLLVGVMDMLAANHRPFVIYAARTETSAAIQCYRALFGPPIETSKRLLTFRTPRSPSRWWDWCC